LVGGTVACWIKLVLAGVAIAISTNPKNGMVKKRRLRNRTLLNHFHNQDKIYYIISLSFITLQEENYTCGCGVK
jgi:hypothetical protein